MHAQFICRTSGSAGKVADMAMTVQGTGYLPGDFYQARSQFVKYVASVTVMSFMKELHSSGVTTFRRAVERAPEVLQATYLLDRLSQAKSVNEEKLLGQQGLIEYG